MECAVTEPNVIIKEGGWEKGRSHRRVHNCGSAELDYDLLKRRNGQKWNHDCISHFIPFLQGINASEQLCPLKL